MYNYQDFSKGDKKLLQSLMEVAVHRAIDNFSKKTLPMHRALVENEHDDIRTPFWELFEQFKDFGKHLTRSFDGYKHRDIPQILAMSIVNKELKMEDLAAFSPEGKEKMENLVGIFESY